MHSLSKICCIFILGLLVNPIYSYVMDRSSSSSSSEETTESPPKYQHVSRISRPGEIVTPTLSELTQFIEAAEYGSNRMAGPSSNSDEKTTVSFKDLLTLLAVWHLANEFNNYDVKVEVKTVQPPSSSPAEMSDNEVLI